MPSTRREWYTYSMMTTPHKGTRASFRYEACAIGYVDGRPQPAIAEQVFARKVDAIAWALSQIGVSTVYRVWVGRQRLERRVAFEDLWTTGEVSDHWAHDGQVFERKQLAVAPQSR